MLTVRNSLLGISAIWMALLLWLITSFWYDAYLQKTDATRILENNQIEDEFLAAAHSWAVERGVSHAALSAGEAAGQNTLNAISAHRRHADESIRRALQALQHGASAETLETAFDTDDDDGPTPEQVRDGVTSQLAKLQITRTGVDQQLALSRNQRDEEVLKHWADSITSVIMYSQRQRVAVRYHATLALREIEALQDLKHAVWVMSEFASREQMIIAGSIAADDPIVLDDVENLSTYRGRLSQAWFNVLAYARTHHAANDVIKATDDVRFFDDFESIRSPVVNAGYGGRGIPDGRGRVASPIRSGDHTHFAARPGGECLHRSD